MPADQEFQVTIGRQGLNTRDSPLLVGLGGFVDSLNWRLDQQGVPTKRLGYETYVEDGGTTTNLPSNPLELFAYSATNVASTIIAVCVNGHAYSSPGDGTWTSIASSLSGTAMPSFAILNDILYWTNGVDNIQKYDGTTHTSLASTPKGTTMCVWRNRLWVSGVAGFPHRVYWSAIADPTTFDPLNFVDIFGPTGDAVNAICTAPNIGSGFEGADGVLVFTERSAHRIVDDTDNVAGAIIGGENVLIDSATGCVAPRTIEVINGIVYLVGRDGIYATTGHSPLYLQSSKLSDFFTSKVNPSSRDTMVSASWKGSYLLSVTPLGGASNQLVLELYTTLPSDPVDRQHPIMPLTIPAAAWCLLPNSTQGDTLFFADSTPGQEAYVRRMWQGGADTTGVNGNLPIAAKARTGQSTFGIPHPKRVRRIQISGRGHAVLIGVVGDFDTGAGETNQYALTAIGLKKWGQGKWGEGKWGSDSNPTSQTRWYTRRARTFGLTLSESSDSTATAPSTLGVAGLPIGAAAIYSAVVCITPLAADS